jgi:large subunit ribosomal protein L11
MKKEIVEIVVDGGKATGGPPLGPKIGPLGLNINEIVKAINEATEGFTGMKIPVKVIVDPQTKKYEIEIGTPSTSALVKKEIGLETGTKDGSFVSNLPFDALVKIAKMKKSALLANDIKAAAKEVIGTCKTLGVTIEGKSPKDMTKEIDAGTYDAKFE